MKKAQVTIFIVIAILLVLGVGLLFLTNRPAESSVSKSENPKGYVEDCVKKQAEKFTDILYQNGLVLNDKDAIKLSSKNVSMLCYTPNYEENCISKYPLMLAMAERDLKVYLETSSEKCFSDLQSIFKEGYKSDKSEITVDIKKDFITINLAKKVELVKNGQGLSFSSFKIEFSNKIFDVYNIASKIVSEEASCNCEENFCRADTLAISLNNPNFKISRGYAGKERVTYTIKNELDKKETEFAVRNCVPRI